MEHIKMPDLANEASFQREQMFSKKHKEKQFRIPRSGLEDC